METLDLDENHPRRSHNNQIFSVLIKIILFIKERNNVISVTQTLL